MRRGPSPSPLVPEIADSSPSDMEAWVKGREYAAFICRGCRESVLLIAYDAGKAQRGESGTFTCPDCGHTVEILGCHQIPNIPKAARGQTTPPVEEQAT